jgi:hypothetical protein
MTTVIEPARVTIRPEMPPAAAAAGVTMAIPLSAADQASIDAYLGAGERMAVLMSLVWKLCVGLIGLTLVAWILGVLPVAVRLV